MKITYHTVRYSDFWRAFKIYDEREGIIIPLGGLLYAIFASHNIQIQKLWYVVDEQQPKPTSVQVLIRRPIINTYFKFNIILSHMNMQLDVFYLNKLTNDSKLISRFKIN